MAAQVEGAAETDGTSTKVPPSPYTSSLRDWVDRPLNYPLDTLPPPQWPNEEAEYSGNLVEVSEKATTFLQLCFGKPLANATRQSLRIPAGVPKGTQQSAQNSTGWLKEALQKKLKKPILHSTT